MSFLDIMFCGFGAVVLLVLILDSNTVQARKETHADLRAEVLRIEKLVSAERKSLSVTQTDLASTRDERALKTQETQTVNSSVKTTRGALSRLDQATLARVEEIEELKANLKDQEKKNSRLQAEVEEQRDQGTRTRRYQGEGDRQYLTGLKVGGKRILILLDASASMLDDTLVNIIRLRNMKDARKRRAEKWRRALTTVEWLVANLPRSSLYQIHSFNVRTLSTNPSAGTRWLKADDAKTLDEAVKRLKAVVPDAGTSLYRAFALAAELSPRPDNILLITDGLPTQGKSKPFLSKVTAEKRLVHFKTAVKQLPKGVPVNTILLPMEGDAYAAAAFWQLAIATRGSFITPSRDWP
jgi:hypothetical protein